MYAELAINVEAPLEGTFHYEVPRDLAESLAVGHLVEVEFGRRLAQGIILAFDDSAPVEETKPVIALIDAEPVVRPWQIELALWLSQQYLAPLNACLRLMLPPGLTRWSDVTYDVNPRWDGTGRLTETQRLLIDLLREKGDLRGRQIARAMPKGVDWRSAARQLTRREILRRATILDPPRIRPKTIRTAELSAAADQIAAAATHFGRQNKKAAVLLHLLLLDDPLPAEADVLEATGAGPEHLALLAETGFIQRIPGEVLVIPADGPEPASADEALLLAQLPAPISVLSDPSGREELERQVAALVERGLAELLPQPATTGLARFRSTTTRELYRLRGAERFYDILNYLGQAAAPTPVGAIYATSGCNLSHLRRLAKEGLIRLGQERIWRDSLADRDFVPGEPPRLTSDQVQVWNQIKATLRDQERLADEAQIRPTSQGQKQASAAFVLHGVTGSGKTEIYLRAVDKALERGKRAIILVPEIALTPQTVRRFAARFPGRVALLHSRLSDGERYDTWRRARQGLFDVVVGPRSALFTPLENLGVVVVDEEHDHSYKQTPPVPPPYYHARETAVQLGRLTGATVIMGSATPDVVSYHRAQAGAYRLLEMPRRIMGHRQRIEGQSSRLSRESTYEQTAGDPEETLTIPLPPVQIVDLRQELRAGNRSIFSRALQQAMDETLERGEQAILFLNRRGTNSFVMCRDCGLVLNCPRCEMPLTYHRPGMMLECHYCGRKEPQQERCPRCNSHRIKYFGLGTEEVERLVGQAWPEARIVRWDRDTTAGRDRHEELLASFINHEADVLVGTQMIAKGLDLPLVTLVGVISADVSLGLPDYGTGERAFQVLAQVAGRAGRGLLGGRVIVQTYQPEHYAIQAAADHDYTRFYLDEIRFRTKQKLPPFRRMAKLVIADPVDSRAEHQARQLAKALRLEARQKALSATELVGPLPPFFNRLDGRYRWQIVIRSPDPNRLLAGFHIPAPWVVDIDPVSVL
ncbi:MAG: primosomal protein N' [Chloroflexota bacterium]|nr:MAG: primosomal protein N' [Chloroflexota bacterium]